MPHTTTPPDNIAAEDQPGSTELVVFSDDWGRHPSSCQHLTSHLLARHRVLWVNTIGTRRPRLSIEDVTKVAAKLRRWFVSSPDNESLPANLTVINPRMYPGFRTRWQRRLNAHLISQSVNRALGPRRPGQRRVVVTTVPIVADLIDRLDVDRWVYYCVDDFSVWPGLDGTIIDEMERQLVRQADGVVAVSQTLCQRLQTMGGQPHLLTHGINPADWELQANKTDLPAWWATLKPPVLLFWGVVDRRLDTAWCQALAQRCGTLVLVGPQQSPDPALNAISKLHMPGPVPYRDLPALAGAAHVLVMPYADLPVTRAIQPLKLKEYLATGKPAVVRKLPSTTPWADTADVVDNIDELVEFASLRARTDTPTHQHESRLRRLATESWSVKAQQLDQILLDDASDAWVSHPFKQGPHNKHAA